MAVNTGFVTTPVQSVTGTLKRSVSDQFRRLFEAVTPFLALVKDVNFDAFGQPSYSNGMIEKESVETMKFEWFTWLPIDQFYTAASGSSSTCVLSDSTAFLERDGIYNETQGCYGIVTRNSSGTTLAITTIGLVAWACSTSDRVCMVGNMYEEASSVATSRTKEPDNNCNYCQTFRYPISIAETALNSPHYGPDLVTRYMTDNTAFALGNVERMFFAGERAASGETTAATPYTTGSAVNMSSMRGMINWSSASPYSVGGAMTWTKWNTELLDYIPTTQQSSNKLIMFCGKKIHGRLNDLAAGKFIQQVQGNGINPSSFGVVPKSFQCGPYEIMPVLHQFFNDSGMNSSALLVDPKDVVYIYKKGLDMRPVNDIQLPSTLGTTRELRGTVSCKVWSSGANILKLTNWSA